jgi:hypothetical protein
MTDESLNLPELPETAGIVSMDVYDELHGFRCISKLPFGKHNLYTADQMAAYVLADRALNRRTPQPDKAIKDAAHVHSCSLYCDRPACIKAQRDQMRDHYQPDKAGVEKIATNVRKWMGPVGQELSAGHVATLHGTILDAILVTPPPPGAGEDRRDGERLDWLESNGTWQFYRTQRANPNEKWFDHATEGSDYSPTLRAAIDAAMRGEGNG